MFRSEQGGGGTKLTVSWDVWDTELQSSGNSGSCSDQCIYNEIQQIDEAQASPSQASWMAYVRSIGHFLPNKPIPQERLLSHLGWKWTDGWLGRRVVSKSGIEFRHFAYDDDRRRTHTASEMVTAAVQRMTVCPYAHAPTYLSVGTSRAPFLSPGIASIIHGDSLAQAGPMEINSNTGFCSSGMQSITNAYRAVVSGDHKAALAVGLESEALSLTNSPAEWDLLTMATNLKASNFVRSSFLRYMLSDGAGILMVSDEPVQGSLEIEWVYSESRADRFPTCMVQQHDGVVKQDPTQLGTVLDCTFQALQRGMEAKGVDPKSVDHVWPHISTYSVHEEALARLEAAGFNKNAMWTNLHEAGNCGAAAIYVLLSSAYRNGRIKSGERALLVVPEAGRFNSSVVCLRML